MICITLTVHVLHVFAPNDYSGACCKVVFFYLLLQVKIIITFLR